MYHELCVLLTIVQNNCTFSVFKTKFKQDNIRILPTCNKHNVVMFRFSADKPRKIRYLDDQSLDTLYNSAPTSGVPSQSAWVFTHRYSAC